MHPSSDVYWTPIQSSTTRGGIKAIQGSVLVAACLGERPCFVVNSSEVSVTRLDQEPRQSTAGIWKIPATVFLWFSHGFFPMVFLWFSHMIAMKYQRWHTVLHPLRVGDKPSIFDGWNPPHRNGDDWGMVQMTLRFTNIGSLALEMWNWNHGKMGDFLLVFQSYVL